MATESAVSADDRPQLTDSGRWSGEVVDAGKMTMLWGTHEFDVFYQEFANGEANFQVQVPRSPPPAAREIVADGLRGDTKRAAFAMIAARAGGIDIDELEVVADA